MYKEIFMNHMSKVVKMISKDRIDGHLLKVILDVEFKIEASPWYALDGVYYLQNVFKDDPEIMNELIVLSEELEYRVVGGEAGDRMLAA